jgi:hypothetical protein
MCTDQYLLREDLRTIKASKDAEGEALPEDIDDDKLKDLEIHGLINDDEEDTDLDEDFRINGNDGNNDDDTSMSTPSASFLLLRQQIQPDRPIGLAQRKAGLDCDGVALNICGGCSLRTVAIHADGGDIWGRTLPPAQAPSNAETCIYEGRRCHRSSTHTRTHMSLG